MTKKYQLLFLIILPLSLFGQKGFDISTGTGYSMPFVDISSTQDTNSGFALGGYHFNAEGRLMFLNNFGLSFSGNFNEFKLNNDALYKSFYDPANDSSLTIENGAWQFKSFALSPVISFPITDKFIIFTKFSGTYSISNLPYIKQIVTSKAGVPYDIIRETAITKAFGAAGGIGFRYFLNDHLAIFTAGDFYFSKPDFQLTGNTHLKYQASYLNISFGFTYKFVPEEQPSDDEDNKKQQTPFMW